MTVPQPRSTTTDDLGEFLMRTLTPVSSKKRPAYEAAKEVRRMVIAEVVAALRTEGGRYASGWAPNAPADFIERELGGQDGA